MNPILEQTYFCKAAQSTKNGHLSIRNEMK